MTELMDFWGKLLRATTPSAMSADEIMQTPMADLARLRKLMERSIAVSARRNVPGQATHPVLLLVEVIRWQREYDGSSKMWWEWNSVIDGAHDRIVNDWLEWHARFYDWAVPTIEDTLARAEVMRGGRADG